MQRVTNEQVRKLIGKTVTAVRKDGSVRTGKLVRFHQNKLYLRPVGNDKGKTVQTKAILPLVLFDLLAIGTLPYYGGYGGYPGFYGPYGYGDGCCNNIYY